MLLCVALSAPSKSRTAGHGAPAAAHTNNDTNTDHDHDHDHKRPPRPDDAPLHPRGRRALRRHGRRCQRRRQRRCAAAVRVRVLRFHGVAHRHSAPVHLRPGALCQEHVRGRWGILHPRQLRGCPTVPVLLLAIVRRRCARTGRRSPPAPARQGDRPRMHRLSRAVGKRQWRKLRAGRRLRNSHR